MSFLGEEEVAALEARLAAWARKRLDAPAAEVRDVHAPMATGFSSTTLLFQLARDGAEGPQERVVARVEPVENPVFPSYDLAKEVGVLRALRTSGIPVPNVRWLELDPSALGAKFYVVDHVEGRVPPDNPPFHVEGWVTDLDAAERAALYASGLEAMARVHRLDPATLDLPPLAHDAEGDDELERQLRYYERFAHWGFDVRRHAWFERTLRYLREAKPRVETVRLCWGDSRLGNQLFEGTRCVALLDWEMVHLGDPLEDLAWWLASDRCFSEGLDVPRLEGLPARDETVRRWSELTGLGAEALPYYEVLALFRFSIQMARIAEIMRATGFLDEDDTFDHDNLATRVLYRVLEERGL